MLDYMKIEHLSIEAREIASMSLAIETAITAGIYTTDNYYDALSLLTTLITEHAKKLSLLVDRKDGGITTDQIAHIIHTFG